MPSKYGFGDTRKKNAPTYMKSSSFKMKGSPMQRNFGIGNSPTSGVSSPLTAKEGDTKTTQGAKGPLSWIFKAGKWVVKKLAKKVKPSKSTTVTSKKWFNPQTRKWEEGTELVSGKVIPFDPTKTGVFRAP